MNPASLKPSLPTALGEFRVQSVLGEGGSGIVYDAIWGPRRVALKVLHPSLADTERVRAQFFAEAQRLQTITHPSVVKVLAFGELPDRRPYLAMERLEGETLASVLARGPISLQAALVLFTELCDAVQTLHAQGLIHRDLKPENVFIVGGVHAVLLDFGIAKDLAAAASTTTMEGNVRGTPAYMAPERFFGQPASIATDVYELAVTLYAMLAGKLPWSDAADPEARLSPTPLTEACTRIHVPAALDVEIRRAMSTRAQNRPASASALLASVREAAGDREHVEDFGPASTARMRSATDARRAMIASAKSESSSDHHAPPPEENLPPPRRVGIAVAIMLVVGSAGALVAWRMMRTRATPVPAAAAAQPDDPWAPRAPIDAAPAPTILASSPPIDVADAQQQTVVAIDRLPADTTMLVTGLVGPLRRDVRFAPLFDKLTNNPQLASLAGGLPRCMTALASGAEWFVFGSVGFATNDQATLIVRGRWTKTEVATCFAAGRTTKEAKVGDATLIELPELGWLDFIDEHTAYVSVRKDLSAAQVHANVAGTTAGLTAHARALLAPLPRDRMLAFVLDGANQALWPAGTMPPGSDATGWVRTHTEGLTFEVVFDAKSDAPAATITAKLVKELDPFKYARIGTIIALQDHTKIRVDGEVPSLVLGMIVNQLP